MAVAVDRVAPKSRGVRDKAGGIHESKAQTREGNAPGARAGMEDQRIDESGDWGGAPEFLFRRIMGALKHGILDGLRDWKTSLGPRGVGYDR